MSDQTYDATTRFSGAKWFNFPQDIVIGGVGGIGSPLAFILSHYQHTLLMYDFDKVEIQNTGTQFYRKEQVGVKKVHALKDNLSYFNDCKNVMPIDEKFEPGSMVAPVAFAAFDKITPRRHLFETWRDQEGKKLIFIDGRLNLDSFEVYVVNTKERIKYYGDTCLPPEEFIPDLPCTTRQTPHMGWAIAAYMVEQFNRWLMNAAERMNYLELPFKSYYNATANLWEYEYNI